MFLESSSAFIQEQNTHKPPVVFPAEPVELSASSDAVSVFSRCFDSMY
jgi:hypothetical protein